MSERKIIGLIMSNPEAVYQQRIMNGVFAQCSKYGYDVAAFFTHVQPSHFQQDYLEAELDIFDLMNFDRLDGVIVGSVSLSDNQMTWLRKRISDKLDKECKKPVISLDLELGRYPVAYTDDRSAFSVITSHLLDVHGCKRIYFLTGTMNYGISEQRLAGFVDEMNRRGLDVPQENIFYGDFWYSGGEILADRIASGELEIPDAVICASDHMALGLANRLIKHGISVPGRVLVTGYDATAEAVINEPTITTYIPDISKCMAEAVNYIRSRIEPGAKIIPAESDPENGLRICKSCGCSEDYAYIKQRLNSSLYNVNPNFGDDRIFDRVDISRLLESYIFESLTESKNPDDCFLRICNAVYLLRPYSDFYLCLNENWLDSAGSRTKGYTDRMLNVIHANFAANPDEKYYELGERVAFDKSLMLPQLYEERSEPYVFYFAPMHFNENSLGYCVLQCRLSQQHKIGTVFKNWVRNVNNALEMVRIQNKLLAFSERDAMTGLYNRRGMKTRLKAMLEKARPADSMMVFVIDMDGLKSINDTYGHPEGDFGISAIASAARRICKNTEICVRAGGDEFYIIGVGDYSANDAIVRMEKFHLAVEEENKASGKDYPISASIGYSCEPISAGIDIEEAIHLADSRMYESKVARKKQRK